MLELRLASVLFSVSLAFTCSAAERDFAADDVYTKLIRLDAASRELGVLGRARALGSLYDDRAGALSSSQIATLSDEDLELLFSATNLVSFYTVERRHASRLRDVFTEIKRRGNFTKEQAVATQGALFAAREFSAYFDLNKQLDEDGHGYGGETLTVETNGTVYPNALEVEDEGDSLVPVRLVPPPSVART